MKKIGLLAMAVLMVFSSCDSYTASGAMVGGLFGSTVGRLAGGWRGGDVGALVGAAVGAAAGAAARDAEQRRAAAYYNDDVYAYPDRYDEKAQRIARYHANTKAKYSGGYNRSTGNGFSLTKRDDSRSSYQTQQTSSQSDKSGYSEDAKYDDRIEMK